MQTIRAIYENGVFKPTAPVELPERCTVEFEPRPIPPDGHSPTARDGVYAVLSERYASGEPDVAARHDEHQP
jgi:predicted DNA-binding antitoxin AbrB/MazE fold protein